MEKSESQAAWQRLKLVIEAVGMTTSSFARYLGLPRGENLYQIKKGNSRISHNLAQRIHDKFPQYPIGWLMCGEMEAFGSESGGAPAVLLPIYRNFPTTSFPPKGFLNGHLILSAEQTGDAQIAVPGPCELLGMTARELLLLLGEPQVKIDEGRVYFVATSRFRLFRTVYYDSESPDCLLLKAAFGIGMDDLTVRRDDVRALWPVCGAVCRLE